MFPSPIILQDKTDSRRGDVLSKLARWQAPFSDADLADRGAGAHAASGLNAAILVLRQIYKVLESFKLDEERILEHEALDFLCQVGEEFSLLATACQDSAEQESCLPQAEVLDTFFKTWRGPLDDLSFAAILGGEQAHKSIWEQYFFHFAVARRLRKRPDDLWAVTGPVIPDDKMAADSLIEWDPKEEPSLRDRLQRGVISYENARKVPAGSPETLMIPMAPAVLRVRLMSAGKTSPALVFDDLSRVELIDLIMETTEHQENERPVFRVLPPGPEILFAQRLIAAVRLRNKPDEPDRVRIFDPKTLAPLGPGVNWSAETTFTEPYWRVGAPGHRYDLFYVRMPEEPTAPQSLAKPDKWDRYFAMKEELALLLKAGISGDASRRSPISSRDQKAPSNKGAPDGKGGQNDANSKDSSVRHCNKNTQP